MVACNIDAGIVTGTLQMRKLHSCKQNFCLQITILEHIWTISSVLDKYNVKTGLNPVRVLA